MNLDRSEWDHVGIPTLMKRPEAVFLAADGVWVTNPHNHPAGVEWVVYEPDSRIPLVVQGSIHVGFRVSDLIYAIGSSDLLVDPFIVGDGFARSAFLECDGAVVELIEYADSAECSRLAIPSDRRPPRSNLSRPKWEAE